MKKYLKLFALASLALGFVACSNDDDNAEQPKEPVILLTKMEQSSVNSDDGSTYHSITTLTYNDQNQLVKTQVNQTTSGLSLTTYLIENKIYYVGGKINGTSSIRTYSSSDGSGTIKDSTKVETDSQGRVIKVALYDDDNFTTPSNIDEYTWTGDKITGVKDVINNKAYTISYTNGNIALLEHTTIGGSQVKYTATFDSKKNFNTLLINEQLAFLGELSYFVDRPRDDDALSVLNTNNILQSRLEMDGYNSGNPKTCSHTYEYNADGYVAKSVEVSSLGATATSICTYTKK